MANVTKAFIRAYTNAVKDRGLRLPEAAQLVADNEAIIVKALKRESSQLGDLVRAIGEIAEFGKFIQAHHDALTGQAQETADLAADLEHEARQFATLAVNMDEVLEAADTVSRYVLPQSYTDSDLSEIIARLACDLRRAAGTSGGVTAALVVRRQHQD